MRRHSYLVGAGGLVGAAVVVEVLLGLRGLRLAAVPGAGLVHGRDVVAQRDGLHRLVDAAHHALADLGSRRRRGGLPGGGGAAGHAVGRLRDHLGGRRGGGVFSGDLVSLDRLAYIR